jgi:hypothetical protein
MACEESEEGERHCPSAVAFIGCRGPIHTEYTIFEDTVPQRTDPFRRVNFRSEVSPDVRIVQPEIGRQLLR